MKVWLVERNLPTWVRGRWRPWGLWHTSRLDAKSERDDHRMAHPDWRFRVRPYVRVEQETER